jgi:hypothetical protein
MKPVNKARSAAKVNRSRSSHVFAYFLELKEEEEFGYQNDLGSLMSDDRVNQSNSTRLARWRAVLDWYD